MRWDDPIPPSNPVAHPGPGAGTWRTQQARRRRPHVARAQERPSSNGGRRPTVCLPSNGMCPRYVRNAPHQATLCEERSVGTFRGGASAGYGGRGCCCLCVVRLRLAVSAPGSDVGTGMLWVRRTPTISRDLYLDRARRAPLLLGSEGAGIARGSLGAPHWARLPALIVLLAGGALRCGPWLAPPTEDV